MKSADLRLPLNEVRIPSLTERLYITVSTHCNLRCRFCAHSRSSIPRRIMPNALFFSVIQKACDFGFSTFNVTPLIGEATLDPGFLDKLDHLERTPGVESFTFCTNFTLVDDAFVERLPRYTKLQWLSITLYGYDANSFQRMTRASPTLFDQVTRNLERLAQLSPERLSHVELRMRSERDFAIDKCTPDLRRALDQLTAKTARIRVATDSYSNWGGMISPADLEGLDIVLQPAVEDKREPCAFAFYKHTVLPDGRLNACSAEDGNATMVIGNLAEQSFHEIYSMENRAYVELIRGQMKGQFGEVCQACCGYRSVRKEHYTYQFHKKPFLRLDEFWTQLAPR